jgi:hypothetical protein
LIEVLFALFLLMTAALIVAATTPVATVSRNTSKLEDKAMDLAQKQVEAIRGAGYANANPTQLVSLGLIDSTNAIGTDPNLFGFTNSDSANLDNPGTVLPNGTGTVEVDQLNLNLVRITVTVSWSDRGNQQSYTLGTLMANL